MISNHSLNAPFYNYIYYGNFYIFKNFHPWLYRLKTLLMVETLLSRTTTKIIMKKGLMRLHSSFLCIHTNNQYSSLRGGSNGNSCCKASFHLLCTRTTGALALFCLWEFFKQKGNRERWEPKSRKETKNRKNKNGQKTRLFLLFILLASDLQYF